MYLISDILRAADEPSKAEKIKQCYYILNEWEQ